MKDSQAIDLFVRMLQMPDDEFLRVHDGVVNLERYVELDGEKLFHYKGMGLEKYQMDRLRQLTTYAHLGRAFHKEFESGEVDFDGYVKQDETDEETEQ